MTTVTFKTKYKKQTRVVNLRRTRVNWDGFRSLLRRQFPKIDLSSTHVTYMDTDGDTIYVTIQEEFEACLEEAGSEKVRIQLLDAHEEETEVVDLTPDKENRSNFGIQVYVLRKKQ